MRPYHITYNMLTTRNFTGIRMSEEELAREIAILLFQQGRLTLAQASRLAGMSRLQFQHLLANRQIPVHYDVAELEEDLRIFWET